MDIKKGEYFLSDNKNLIDLDTVYGMLSKSYWASERAKETIKKSIDNSNCYGLYLREEQIGFLRVVTDRATFAWICDVIIKDEHRGKGLGKWMVDSVVNQYKSKDLLQLLATRDAHGLYESFGFNKKECMARRN